jgi:DtxR family Mn-dependent transcriptional regulator
MPTISKEDYLKAIYNEVTVSSKTVSTAQLAGKLSVSNSATCDMAKKLADQGLIVYAKYKGIDLTSKGKKIALDIIRRHRLWELFLMKVLDLSWSEVHDEAEKLEHQTSNYLINKIDDFLDHPDFDPHGDPIPKRNGELPDLPKFISLKDCEVGKKYKIIRVNDENNEIIEYFTKLGLLLHKEITVIEKLSFDNTIFIQDDDTNHTLSEKVADKLSVELIK